MRPILGKIQENTERENESKMIEIRDENFIGGDKERQRR